MSSTKLSTLCDKVLEIGWLLAVIITPLFFNVYSSRVFEPDKLTTLRTVAVIMAAVWVVKLIEERTSGGRGIEITWRTPLVLPAIFTVCVYLVSTALSVTRWVSFFGSYQRLQGTYTTLSYIVLFFIILQELRTRAQLDRLITVIILNSLPIALYGFLQHNRLDPLPWGGDVTDRIASNMGNAIFVAAYMIMAAFPTLARIVGAFRSILADEEASTADVLRAAVYIFIFLVQIIAIWFSQSRGPLMGLLAGLGVWAFLGLLTLQRAARQERSFQPAEFWGDLGRGLGFGLGSLAMAGVAAVLSYFIGKGLAALWPGRIPDAPRWAAAVGGVISFFALWLAFVVGRRGWRWLWASALLIAILAATGFLSVNLIEPLHAWSVQQPWLGRLDDVLQSESGTGKVRALIWEGALRLIGPHAAVRYPPTQEYPEGRSDPINALRFLVGYGPESMYVAYNGFYPPQLGHIESRTASPDRSHNETMDSLVITGLLGFAAYVWIFGGIFYFGLRWLGLLPDGWRRTLFFALVAGGAVAAVAAVIPTIGAHFFCLAIPVGMVGGLFLYLIVYGISVYRDPAAAAPAHPYAILLTGILAAVVAHLIEINFGIAIASTRTTFWAYAAAFVVAGALLIRERGEAEERRSEGAGACPERSRREQGNRGAGEQEGRRRKKRRRAAQSPVYARPTLPGWLGITLAVAIVGGFMLGTLAFDFVTTPNQNDAFFTANPEKLGDPFVIVWRSMTALPNRSVENCAARWDPLYGECRSFGVLLLIFILTWLMGAVILISEMVKNGAFRERKDDWLLATGLYLFTSFIVGFVFALVLAGNQAAVVPASRAIQSLSDLKGMADLIAGTLISYYGFIIFALIAGGAVLLLGTRLPRPGAQPWGVIALVVLVVLASATIVTTNLRPIQADTIYKQAEPWEQSGQWQAAIGLYQYTIELAPREDFYYLYLGRALLEYARGVGDPAEQDNIMQMTEQTLSEAREINPLNTDHSANLARMYSTWRDFVTQSAANVADPETQQGLLQRAADLSQLASDNYALATMLSPHHAILWNEWALLYLAMGDIGKAQETISHSLQVDPDFDQSWVVQARIYVSQGVITDAVQAYDQALEINPGRTDVLLELGDAYLNQGQFEQAAAAYEQILEINPQTIDAWLRLGNLHMTQNQLEEAAADYEQALTLDPSLGQVWRVLGVYVYAPLGRLDEAAAALEKVLELEPQASDAWDIHRMLATIYAQGGQNDVALSHAQMALELAPEDQKPAVQDLIAQLEAIIGGTQP
jgi:tetratricopeptide (TPR) repeat protein